MSAAQGFAQLPVVPPSDWLKAQKMQEAGLFNICFKYNNTYIVPSTKLLNGIPNTVKTIEAKKMYISVSFPRSHHASPEPRHPGPARHAAPRAIPLG